MKMRRLTPPVPGRDSIFGDTWNGVPSPFVPHISGYPTRYHGPNFVMPQPDYEYAGATYVKAPFLGFGDDSSFADLGRAALGAGFGYFMSEEGASATKKATNAALGAGIAYVSPVVGLIGYIAYRVWKGSR